MKAGIKIENGIAKITLCAPPSNIISFEMMDDLSAAVREAKGCRLMIFDSSLDHFSTGVDVKIHTPEIAPEMLRRFHALITEIYNFSGITVCLLNGYVLGGGLELALVCDLIFIDRDAQAGFPEIKLACFPPVAAVLLPRKIGKRADYLLYTGGMISAEQAYEIGIADRLFTGRQHANELVNELQHQSGDALKSLKKAVRLADPFDFKKQLGESENIYLGELLKSPDVQEGVNAFLEKRPPKYN